LKVGCAALDTLLKWEENEKDDLEYDFKSGYSCGECLGWCIWWTGYDGLADK